MSDRQKLFLALLVSALFHLALGLVLASWTGRHVSDTEPTNQDLSRLTVTIMPPKRETVPKLATAPTLPPVNPLNRPVLDSDGLTRSKKAPEHPIFQSDSNMVAGSQLPGTGNIPLPTQQGVTRKFMDFADQAASLGKGQEQADLARTRREAQAPQSMPAQRPPAVTKVQPTPLPKQQPAAQPTPKPIPTPPPDALALGKPTPTPEQAPSPDLAGLNLPPSMRAEADMAPMTSQPPTPPAPPSPPVPELPPVPPAPARPPQPESDTQRELEKTRIDGGINTAGAPGVDAVETPFGRYHRKLSNLIGSRWQLYLQEHPKDVGDVTILVKLDTNGKVTATRVIANHSLDDLAELSTRAIMESDLPPVPDDLAPMLRDGKLEITFNFNVYDPSNDTPPGR